MKFNNQKHGVGIFIAEVVAFLLFMCIFFGIVGVEHAQGQMVDTVGDGSLWEMSGGVSLSDGSLVDTAYAPTFYVDADPKYTIIDTIRHEVEVCDTVEEWKVEYVYAKYSMIRDTAGATPPIIDSYFVRIGHIECQTKTVVDSVIVKMSMEQWEKIKPRQKYEMIMEYIADTLFDYLQLGGPIDSATATRMYVE